MSRVGVLGAGSWGTSLANLLAHGGHDVRLWAYEPAVVEAVNTGHENPLFLPGIALHPELRAFASAADVVAGCPVVLSVTPSHVTRTVLESVQGVVASDAVLVSATKGIEDESLALMSDVASATVPSATFVALSGPSFAREVAEGQPTAVVAAARDESVARAIQDIFSSPTFRVYTNTDVVGVELAGALKNVIAVAAGVLEGLGLGHNPRAALLTRGLAEISRLGVALGADPLTFAGLAGMGDLILTATGSLSRNRALGLALAQEESLESYRARHRTVAEGANTSRAATRLAARTGVEMPIAAEVCAILFEGKSARASVRDLMERDLKAEQWR